MAFPSRYCLLWVCACVRARARVGVQFLHTFFIMISTRSATGRDPQQPDDAVRASGALLQGAGAYLHGTEACQVLQIGVRPRLSNGKPGDTTQTRRLEPGPLRSTIRRQQVSK